jgi:D-alanyl-D-alanine carboxypeptidase/D-alanyl-D-alanine-endopeptidase (penicillin-binding protein 4)
MMTTRIPRLLATRPRLLAVAALTASIAAAPAIAAQAATPTPTYQRTLADQRIAAKLNARVTTTRFGAAFSGAVVDAATGTLLWSHNGWTGEMPASTTKWVTATDALSVFGGSHRFTTTVRRGGQADQVVLVGSGDPGLSSAQLADLAKTTATVMKAKGQLRVRLYADDTLFAPPTLAIGWRSDYIPADTTWLRALVVDGRQSADTTMQTAAVFAADLKANGIAVASTTRAKASTANPILASSDGRTVSQLVSTMMLNSDNEYAEALHRLVSIRTGFGATWTAARNAQKAQLVKQGLAVNALYDGSGLSRSDRITGIQMAHIVSNIFEPGNAGLPVSGQTGTLRAAYGRFTTAESRCAVGKVHAKTGTLSDAVALSGWTVGADGRVKAFAFEVNGRSSTLALKQSVDMLAATVVGCY